MRFGNDSMFSVGMFRARFLLAVFLAWGLIYTDQRLGDITGSVRNQLASWVITPIRVAAQFPTAAWTTTSDYFKSRDELIVAKNELEEELLRERVRLNLLRQVERDNDTLRRLIDERERKDPDSKIAKIINTASLPFINRIVLSKGSKDGVIPGSGVFNDDGVIGRLTRVDHNNSQALLLTDKRFWVATRNRRDNSLVLLQGDGGGRMRMRFVPAEVDLQQGDVLVTAGGASSFPSGLPVAAVDLTWVPSGTPFREGYAVPIASVRQDTALLIHEANFEDVPVAKLPVTESGAVPANFSPDVLP